MPRLCQAITTKRSAYKSEFGARCQNTASFIVNGVGLCGTHLNQGFRARLEVVIELPLLKDRDLP